MTDRRNMEAASTTDERSSQSDEVVVVEYNPLWPTLFEEEKARILSLINPWVARVEHIGSTAIPGLGAKPIIDIMVGLRSLDDARHCIPVLETIGYEYVPKYEIVMPERRYFRKGSPRSKRTHHLHMVETASEFWERHLLFRDYLREHEETAGDYYELKKALAERFRFDLGAYTDAKTDFIQQVVEQAGRGRSDE